MTRTLRTALPLIAALTIGTLASAASAMTVTNCTGTGIRVHVYDNADAIQAFARTGGEIHPGYTATYEVREDMMALKIFQMGLIDQMRLAVSFVEGAHAYRIVAHTNGGWELQYGNSCT